MTSPMDTLRELVLQGGFVMPPLGALTLMLWYALGARAFGLRGTLLVDAKERVAALRERRARLDRDHLDDALVELVFEAARLRRLIRGLVTVAPLLGLLGTVTGMIETFDSLADMALFSSTGGIAGGVSQALLTTQVGLTIAIPGLLLGRTLDRRERRITDEMERLKDQALLGGTA